MTDCPEPACKSKADAMRNMFAKSGKMKAQNPASNTTADGSTSAVVTGEACMRSSGPPCPPDRDELGRHSWTLLHSFAAYFPNVPTSAQSSTAHQFIRAIVDLYPCRHCAEDFKVGLEENPPRYASCIAALGLQCEADPLQCLRCAVNLLPLA